MILTLVQWGPESTLKAGLAFECPPPRVTGLRTVGRVGAPGSAPPWIFRLRVPSSQTSEVPSPGSRAHAGRPLKQREGKWGSLSPQPNTHMGRQRAPPHPRPGKAGVARQSAQVLHLAGQSCQRLKPGPAQLRGSLSCQPQRSAPLPAEQFCL